MDNERPARPQSALKSPAALRTIGEVSAELGVPQHILRYWEGRFPQLRPLQRAGNRRYYRPDDVALLRQIRRLLEDEGYTVRGVQKLLADKSANTQPIQSAQSDLPMEAAGDILTELHAIRDLLTAALREDEAAI